MKKIVIIGGGVAGLTAGIFALRRGAAVTLIDKNGSGAGALCGWRRGGCTVDGCLHWLTGTREGTELYEIWQKTGMLDGEVVKQEVFFSSEADGASVSFYDDAERTAEEMTEKFPEDGREIAKFFTAVRAASSLSGTEEGGLSKAASLAYLAPYALLSAGEVAERFESAAMKRAMSDLTGKYYSSLGLIFAYSAFSSGNGYLPRGGSPGAAKRMRDKFVSLGGELTAPVRAERIERRGGEYAVTTSDGRVVTGDGVICCIDPLRAARTLFDKDVTPKSCGKKVRNKAKYPIFSSVHFAFSADASDVHFRGTSFFPCRRHGVGSVNRDRMMLKEYSHEPSFAPHGKTVLQTMLFADESECRRWIALRSDGGAYAAEKARAASDVTERIKERYPSFGGSLELIDSWTPATYSRYLGSACGSYMSFALTPATMPPSFPMRLKGADGVIFASSRTSSPGGVPNAAYAGKRAVDMILG